jgi:integrase
MPRKLVSRINLLTTRAVMTAADGDHSDGGCLVLRVVDGAARWVFRYTAPSGRRREMGLGPCYRDNTAVTGQSLVLARKAAGEARELLAQGKDPIDERQATKRAAASAEKAKRSAVKAEKLTLARAARAYHERVIEPNRTSKHAANWIATLENHVPPAIWNKPIAEVTAAELLDVLLKLHGKIPETALRVRQRLDAVFEDALFRAQCSSNPASAIRRKLREQAGDRERGNFAALPYPEVPAFMQRLREREAVAARALEFAVLTAARTGEVIGATWTEFDLKARLWTIPGARMKGGEPHLVYLPPRAVEIAAAMQAHGQPFVFSSPDGGPLSNMAMLTLLRRMDADKRTTVHGLCRASFSTWAYETNAARPDVIEACLAHQEADRVKASYNRAQFAEDRRKLLLAWHDFVLGVEPTAANDEQQETAQRAAE